MARILLRFPENIVDQPIISQVISEYNISLNILAARVNSQGGEVLAEIPSEDIKRAVKAFRDRGVIVAFPKLIEVDREKCLHCGACYSLCPAGAITINKEDFSVIFDYEKCIGSSCAACVDACPVRAITLSRELGLLERENEDKKINQENVQS